MKTKHFLFILLFISTGFICNAQDKYEFLTISYQTIFPHITVSIDGKELLQEEVKPENKIERLSSNANPLIKKVREYQEQNWEVMSFDVIPANGTGSYQTYFAFMRRKIK